MQIIAHLTLTSSVQDLAITDAEPRCLLTDTNLSTESHISETAGTEFPAVHRACPADRIPPPAKMTMASVLPALKLREYPNTCMSVLKLR